MGERVLNAKRSNGPQAFEALGRFLAQESWGAQQVQDAPIYRMSVYDSNGPLTCYAHVRVQEEVLLCYAIAPVRVPEAARVAVAEFILRVNYELWIGSFELAWDDGEIRYKSSLDFEGATLTPTLIRNTLSPTVQMMRCYLPGIITVIHGKAPDVALTEIEETSSICDV